MQAIIGIDIGTTNTKAIAFTKDGKVLASANVSYAHVSGPQGYDEIEPSIILNAVVDVMKKILADAKPKAEICGISFSCAMHSLLAVDENGLPLTNMITWADLRSAGEAAKIKFTETGNKIYELTGTPIHAMTPLCKILWLKNNEPDIFSRAQKFIGIKEYLWHQFFGKFLIDYSLASATGLFNIYEFNWYEESLNLAGISSDKLSVPVEPTHIETVLTKKYKEEFGLNNDVPFIIGGSDGCLANLGSNAIRQGDTALTIGTSGALRMASAKPKHDPKQRIFNYILTKNLYISGGGMNNGGVVVQWYIKNFLAKSTVDEKGFSNFLEMINEVPAGSDGLIFLPYLLGERAPIWNADAKGVFFGINTKHTEKHFLRAVIEGISFALYQIGISLEETIGEIKSIYASGGFIQSKAWLQIIADVFNKEVIVSNVADASAIGAAIIGFKAVGLIDDLDEISDHISVQQKFMPDESRHKIYMQNISKFSSVYNKLKDEF
jgi:gluconokinase